MGKNNKGESNSNKEAFGTGVIILMVLGLLAVALIGLEMYIKAPESTDDYVRALALYEEGEYEKAYGLVKSSNTLKSNNLKGNIKVQLEELDEAIEYYTKGLKKEVGNVTLLTNRGSAYFNGEMYEEAEEDFNKVIGIDAENAVGYMNIGTLYAHTERYFESLAALEKAKDLGNKDAEEYMDNVNKMSQEHLNNLFEKGELDIVEDGELDIEKVEELDITGE